MVDCREEFEKRWCEWVVDRKCELEVEFTALMLTNDVRYLVWSVLGAGDSAFPLKEVVICDGCYVRRRTKGDDTNRYSLYITFLQLNKLLRRQLFSRRCYLLDPLGARRGHDDSE
jgi:hypothetical protein